ncbi:MAG TPA: hypothetical protein VFB76_17200 [Candidatus Angelobacter sp.]|nr:hypothetical protein [Candidatus Angelobacter sp.]
MGGADKKPTILARFRAFLRKDWNSEPGVRFRKTISKITDYSAKQGISISDLTRMGIDKLRGLSEKELAEAMKNFSEAERKQLETIIETKLFQATIAERVAMARLAVAKADDAEFELYKKLKEARGHHYTRRCWKYYIRERP